MSSFALRQTRNQPFDKGFYAQLMEDTQPFQLVNRAASYSFRNLFRIYKRNKHCTARGKSAVDSAAALQATKSQFLARPERLVSRDAGRNFFESTFFSRGI